MVYRSIILFFFIFLFFIITLWISYQKTIEATYIPRKENFSKNKKISPSILTYNIQKFPWSPKTFTAVRSLFQRHSIILLQECYDETFSSLESHFPDYYICRGTMQGISLINSGLVILSKYPIRNSSFVTFKQYNPLTFDRLTEKGFLITWIRIGENTVRVINTHLQSSDFERYDPYAFLQMEELFDYIGFTKKGKFIIGGDFNIDISFMKKRYMPSENKLSLWHPVKPTIYINFSTGHSQSNRQFGYDGLVFDYFFTSKDIEMEPVTIESPYSDHNPVESDIKLLL